ncbi:hypothetical protein BC830DRAFT_172629 [Chytriomyces sp. MP71]|nr:hypothetical protein BC830DRAFT_172629 [Chytriomyces sp. MP71]
MKSRRSVSKRPSMSTQNNDHYPTVSPEILNRLGLGVNLQLKPAVGSAGKRALLPFLGVRKTEENYISSKTNTSKSSLKGDRGLQFSESLHSKNSKPKSKASSTDITISDKLHHEFQKAARNVAKSRESRQLSVDYTFPLFDEVPACLLESLEQVVSILKKKPLERKIDEIAVLRKSLMPLNAFTKIQSQVMFDQLVYSFTIQEVPKRHTVFMQGDYGDAWYVLLLGRADIRVATGGDVTKNHSVRILPAGEGFGLTSMNLNESLDSYMNLSRRKL